MNGVRDRCVRKRASSHLQGAVKSVAILPVLLSRHAAAQRIDLFDHADRNVVDAHELWIKVFSDESP